MLEISVESVNDLIKAWYRANLLEYSTDKPGNVGPIQIINYISYEDYHRVNLALRDFLKLNFSKFPQITLGGLIYSLVETMMHTPPHQNLFLGNILLISPLFLAAVKQFRNSANSKRIPLSLLWTEVSNIIAQSTVEDTLKIIDAIRSASPGGLKNPGGTLIPSELDLLNPKIMENIIKNKVHILSFFQESSSFDLISQEWVSGYKICQTWMANHFSNLSSNNMKQYKGEISENIIQIYLELLATYPDSLIVRKNSLQKAEKIQQQAQNILFSGGLTTESGRKLYEEFSLELNSSNGKLNPGTIADFTAAILFLIELVNLKFDSTILR